MKIDNPLDTHLEVNPQIPYKYQAAITTMAAELNLAWLTAQSVFGDMATPEAALGIYDRLRVKVDEIGDVVPIDDQVSNDVVTDFLAVWEAGEAGAPYHSCLTTDLHEVFLQWCSAVDRVGVSMQFFLLCVKKVLPVKRMNVLINGRKEMRSFYICGDCSYPQGRQLEWASGCVKSFRAAAFADDSFGEED